MANFGVGSRDAGGDKTGTEDTTVEGRQTIDTKSPAGSCATTYRLYVEGVSSTEVIRRLTAAGWVLARTKGSHHHFKKTGKANLVTVPHPKRDLPLGTLKSIERTSGVSMA